MAFGAWEGLTLDEARAKDPDGYRTWAETPELFTAPGGETLADVRSRVLGGAEAAARRARGQERVPGGARPLRARHHPGSARTCRCRACGPSPRLDRHLGARVPPGLDGVAPDEHPGASRRRSRRPLRAGPDHGAPSSRRPAPQGREDLPARRGRQQARGGGAPPRRLPPLGLSRGGDAHLRVLRRAVQGARTTSCRSGMFKMVDRESGRLLALRADITPQIARIVATRMRDEPKPLRLGYVTNVFRYDEPQVGRYREFYQAGVELVGLPNPEGDAEMIAMTVEGLRALGLVGVPDRRGPDRLLPRHPRGPRRRCGDRARAALGAGAQGRLRAGAPGGGPGRARRGDGAAPRPAHALRPRRRAGPRGGAGEERALGGGAGQPRRGVPAAPRSTASPTACCSTWARCAGSTTTRACTSRPTCPGSALRWWAAAATTRCSAASATTARPPASRSRWAGRCSPWSRRARRPALAGPDFFIIDFTPDKTRALALARRYRDLGAAVARDIISRGLEDSLAYARQQRARWALVDRRPGASSPTRCGCSISRAAASGSIAVAELLAESGAPLPGDSGGRGHA